MTEKEIILLGFEKEDINEYENDDSYYYALDIVDGLTFITSDNSDENWNVEIFNTNPLIRFTEFGEVQGLINQLTKAIVK
jgi:hypothetical protein